MSFNNDLTTAQDAEMMSMSDDGECASDYLPSMSQDMSQDMSEDVPASEVPASEAPASEAPVPPEASTTMVTDADAICASFSFQRGTTKEALEEYIRKLQETFADQKEAEQLEEDISGLEVLYPLQHQFHPVINATTGETISSRCTLRCNANGCERVFDVLQGCKRSNNVPLLYFRGCLFCPRHPKQAGEYDRKIELFRKHNYLNNTIRRSPQEIKKVEELFEFGFNYQSTKTAMETVSREYVELCDPQVWQRLRDAK